MSDRPLHGLSNINFYGIQLDESEYRSWENLNDYQSELTFHWERLKAKVYDQKQNIQIAVAQAMPKANQIKIKEITNTIWFSRDIHEFDRIFGLIDQRIERVGYISDRDIVNNEKLKLTVDWVPSSELGETERPLFKPEQEYQRLNRLEVIEIEERFGSKLDEILRQMPPPRLDEALEAYKLLDRPHYIEQKLFSKESKLLDMRKEDQGGAIQLFYATNRNREDSKGNRQNYGDEETAELKYGVCEVDIPTGHQQGELERPGRFMKVLWRKTEKPDDHFIITEVNELEADDFWHDFRQKLNYKYSQQALLFVHGYRNTFDDAAYRTAQLAWDLQFEGYTGFYSWPSAGTLLPYAADGAAARSSAPFLKAFITQVCDMTGIEQLHIIAHSMGGLVLTLALKDLTSEPYRAETLGKIHQLILGAPDIDQREFRNSILPAFKEVGSRRTLYASDHDQALHFSGNLRSHRDRLGTAGRDIFVAEGLDTVEVSNVESNDSHGYIFKSKSLLNDIYYLITQGLPPARRRLREIRNTPVNHWLFPK